MDPTDLIASLRTVSARTDMLLAAADPERLRAARLRAADRLRDRSDQQTAGMREVSQAAAEALELDAGPAALSAVDVPPDHSPSATSVE